MFAAAQAAADAAGPIPAKLSYGTAGFRAVHDRLDALFTRMGMLAALRSACCGQQAIGVMVTASHNAIEDNGVKMIDPDGGMLHRSWEEYASQLADTPVAEVGDALAAIAAKEGVASLAGAAVYVACDTRPSSPRLTACVKAGAAAMGATVTDCGVLTTPQLHHIVRFKNLPPSPYAGEEGYYRMMREAFEAVLGGVDANEAARGPIELDCAHGVGAPQAARLAVAMKGLVGINPRNTGATPEEAALLNDGVGAEHAQKTRSPPAGFTAAGDAGKRCASLDGDADRLVYHYFEPASGAWKLLDGDKIATLAAVFFAEQLAALGWPVIGEPTHAHHGEEEAAHAATGEASAHPPNAVSVGLVQTAYANGASTSYITHTLRLPVVLAKTGVKFVHHAATAFDLGIYFEANGHGTVLFHPAFLARLQAFVDSKDSSASPSAAAAACRLLAASRLINQAIGDALSDALFVEAVLVLKGWSVADWDALYADLPSYQAKLTVPDRNAIRTTADETRVVEPAAIQAAIDAAVAAVEGGRAFVRPSGTEDAVRVYAEATTEAAAKALGVEVLDIVRRHFSA